MTLWSFGRSGLVLTWVRGFTTVSIMLMAPPDDGAAQTDQLAGHSGRRRAAA
jgi:hypothetical protein